jgi:cytochrome c oxidase assembly protein subunit 15
MNETVSASTWPRRTAWITACLAFPLLLLGGTVTTLRVGMAVPDWPTTFGQNMFTYPLSKMLEDHGVFFEHSHRLWGALVGMATIAMLVAHVRFEKRALVRGLAIAAFVVVCVQGLLGGLRVIENSSPLAFVHGAVAQALFALFGAIVVMHSSAWHQASATSAKRDEELRRIATSTPILVYVQIAIGGWLRHSGNMTALGLHVALAALATGAVLVLARELRLGAQDGTDRAHLAVIRKRLFALLWAQLALGVLAAIWIYVITGPHNPVSIGEAIFATLHVAVGALLLSNCVAAHLWARRVTAPGEVVRASSASLGTVR